MSEPTPPPQRASANRWLAFLPSLLIFIFAASQSAPGHGDERIDLHDELIAFGFISGFVALLWVSSQRFAAAPSARRSTKPPRSFGFEVVAKKPDDAPRP